MVGASASEEHSLGSGQGSTPSSSFSASPAASKRGSWRLRINVLQARGLKYKLSVGEVAPQVKVLIGSDNQTTSTKWGTSSPVWHEAFEFPVTPSEQAVDVGLRVYSKHIRIRKVFLGRCESIPVRRLLQGAHALEPAWYPLYNKSGKKERAGEVQIEVALLRVDIEHNVKVFIGTWNVGNAPPPADLSSWIPQDESNHIVVVGAQECQYSARSPYSSCDEDWQQHFKQHLGPRYRLLTSQSLGQMRLLAFVRDDAEGRICGLTCGTEATGVGHVYSNKGGVAVAFKVGDTWLCFVNSHFAAHAGQCAMRNSNFREIVGEISIGQKDMDLLTQFHHVFWMGDLNYRLDLPAAQSFESKTSAKSPNTEEFNRVLEQINQGSFSGLLAHDELHRDIKLKKVFSGFKEGDITFAPTFKVHRNEVVDDFPHGCRYLTSRLPAWCDRILWKSVSSLPVKQLLYRAAPLVVTSDHKPVCATFEVPIVDPPRDTKEPAIDEECWHIVFMSLSGYSLLAKDVEGTSDPYTVFQGPALVIPEQTPTIYKCLNPVWDPKASTWSTLPKLALVTQELDVLQYDIILIRVMDYDIARNDDCCGRGMLPLRDLVESHLAGEPTYHFEVDLTSKGARAGQLCGDIQLKRERRVRRASRTYHLPTSKSTGALNKLIGTPPIMLPYNTDPRAVAKHQLENHIDRVTRMATTPS
eukprot:jgi/Chlat1/2087/Chrsp17S02691